MYDWTAPLPPCDHCGELEVDEDLDWLDQEDFWGHADCYWARRRQAHKIITVAEVTQLLDH